MGGRQIGNDIDTAGQGCGQLADHGGEEADVPVVAGQLERQRGAVPHVLGRAPATRVHLVDDLEADLPVVVRVIGYDQPDARHDDRFAAQAAQVAVEAGGERGDLAPGGLRRAH